jgi:hypothetical protein
MLFVGKVLVTLLHPAATDGDSAAVIQLYMIFTRGIKSAAECA